jgi:hypothetical protein
LDEKSPMEQKAKHVEEAVLSRFLLGQASAEECRQVVRHLLSGCELCQQRTRPMIGAEYGEISQRLKWGNMTAPEFS